MRNLKDIKSWNLKHTSDREQEEDADSQPIEPLND